ncbi:hypothetical protein T07_2576 [Trichinella nelsoni]|uniref:Uncharacterized protein n=1 Tax=Trichinella nelsoni TaxID=6336 RepID=A0A0V0S5B2_9BILA|nr:hypothetical protein T07_2576 [Trichinella nelsoni]
MVIHCPEGNSFSIAEIRAQLTLGRRSVWLQSCCAKHDFRMRDVLLPLLMIYWETYLVKPFATLNTMISAVFLQTVQRPCVLDCRKCQRELRKLFGKWLRANIITFRP